MYVIRICFRDVVVLTLPIYIRIMLQDDRSNDSPDVVIEVLSCTYSYVLPSRPQRDICGVESAQAKFAMKGCLLSKIFVVLIISLLMGNFKGLAQF